MAGIEDFVNGNYRRAIRLGDHDGALEVRYDPSSGTVVASVFDQNGHQNRIDKQALYDHIHHAFDIGLDPQDHLNQLTSRDAIAQLFRKEAGLRIPTAWDGFETAVCIILAQLVSLKQARAITKKLIEAYGSEIKKPIFPNCHRRFPTPERLKDAELTEIGLAKTRQSAVRNLATLVHAGGVDLSQNADPKATRKTLLAVDGIGKWTAEMIALRCLGDRNAFPSTDLVVKRALLLHNLPKGDWTPWNAYIILALWKTYAKALNPAKVDTKSNTDRSLDP